jgi:predicted dehydrogenase
VREWRVAFSGAGAIARAHAFSLDALPSYYPDAPRITRVAVASPTDQSRRAFAARHGFAEAVPPDDLWRRDDIDAVFLLGPNETHWPQLRQALRMKNAHHVYLEKPPCSSRLEEQELAELAEGPPGGKVVHLGFQFLQLGPARRALRLARAGAFGPPVHFHASYLHGGYLDAAYRKGRQTRLRPAPAGGATADLGSHLFSLLVAFFGGGLEVVAARDSGSFPDVPAGSDLCTVALLRDSGSGAVGPVVASRISAGAGDVLELEIRYAGGAFRLSSERPDVLETLQRAGPGGWSSLTCGNDYSPASAFPSPHVSSGWLRPLLHAHYLFLGGPDPEAVIPNLGHALAVQRLLRRTAETLGRAREGEDDRRGPAC